MDGAITEVDEATYLQGELMWEALSKYGSPELINSYNTQFDADSYSHGAKKTAGIWDGINTAVAGLSALNQLSHKRENQRSQNTTLI